MQSLETLPISELAQRLREETTRFLRRDPLHDERPGLALFRIAFLSLHNRERADAAWAALYAQYEPLVVSWIAGYTHSQQHAALVNTVFAKFFQALTKEHKIEQFSSLARILRYLKLCTSSVIADARRAQQNQTIEEQLDAIPHEPATGDPAEFFIDQLAMKMFWQKIRSLVEDEVEYLLLELTYQQGMKPQEIQVQYPHLFSSLEDIYRIKRNVLERLRRRSHLFTHAA